MHLATKNVWDPPLQDYWKYVVYINQSFKRQIYRIWDLSIHAPCLYGHDVFDSVPRYCSGCRFHARSGYWSGLVSWWSLAVRRTGLQKCRKLLSSKTSRATYRNFSLRYFVKTSLFENIHELTLLSQSVINGLWEWAELSIIDLFSTTMTCARLSVLRHWLQSVSLWTCSSMLHSPARPSFI